MKLVRQPPCCFAADEGNERSLWWCPGWAVRYLLPSITASTALCGARWPDFLQTDTFSFRLFWLCQTLDRCWSLQFVRKESYFVNMYLKFKRKRKHPIIFLLLYVSVFSFHLSLDYGFSSLLHFWSSPLNLTFTSSPMSTQCYLYGLQSVVFVVSVFQDNNYTFFHVGKNATIRHSQCLLLI